MRSSKRPPLTGSLIDFLDFKSKKTETGNKGNKLGRDIENELLPKNNNLFKSNLLTLLFYY